MSISFKKLLNPYALTLLICFIGTVIIVSDMVKFGSARPEDLHLIGRIGVWIFCIGLATLPIWLIYSAVSAGVQSLILSYKLRKKQ